MTEFKLTLTSGVAKDNDRPVGIFFHESDAANCGFHLLLADKNGDAPEYLGYRIDPCAAPPMVADVVKAAQDLLDACIAEFGLGDESFEGSEDPMWGDESKVSYPEETCSITFGHIRRLKAALEQSK